MVHESPEAQPEQQKAWLVLFTRSHHEKRVAEHLRQRGVESFLPLYKTVRQWTHYRKVALDLPLFPSYLFINIAPHEPVRTLEVPGVLSVVRDGRKPARLSDEEIERLRSGLHLRTVEPHPYLAVGEKARITAGPLAGMQGIIVRQKSGLRMVLTVETIMQSIAVEVASNEVEAYN